ncbi:MAG: hypothetical protein A2076_06605 [Geobacteraceae bacterium GWC2_53_11]|nr:MAG: hypothetical protein A2076_06605 [Geobacteraceae bacterium GWC2_53_11]
MARRFSELQKRSAVHKWLLAELPDRGLGMVKILSTRRGKEVTVVVRSNAIAIYRSTSLSSDSQLKDRLHYITALDVSLEKLAGILNVQDAAETMAVFTMNRRELLHSVKVKDTSYDQS